MLIRGKLIKCNRGKKTFKNKETENKLWITVGEVNLTDKQMTEIKEAFKNTGVKMTPEWVKNFEGYVNTSTKFGVPCKDMKGNQFESVEDMIADNDFPWMGAEVGLSLVIKEGAIYPKSMVFYSEGTPFNPFDEFEGETEEDLPINN